MPVTPRHRVIPDWAPRAAAIAMVVAGMVHIGTVLRLAYRPDTDAYRVVEALAPGAPLQTFAAPPDADRLVPYRDPAMAEAFCLFDLSAGAIEVSLPVNPLDFAVVSVHGDDGGVLYTLTNGAAVGGAITLSLTLQAAAGADDAPAGALRVPLPKPRGFVMVQALADLPSQRQEAAEASRRLSCRRLKS
jgi:uncharacterized membrane protein